MTLSRAIVLDIETVPDLEAGRRLLHLAADASPAEVKQAMVNYCRRADEPDGTVFIKPVLQKIVAVAVVEAERAGATPSDPWIFKRVVSGHTGASTEQALIRAAEGVVRGSPQPLLVGWHTLGFDLPVIRYRAMALSVPIPALSFRYGDTPRWKYQEPRPRDYFSRYAFEDHLDLVDVLSCYGSSPKAKLSEIAAALDVPVKIGGFDGAKVDEAIAAGEHVRVAEYCETDVLALACVWLRYLLAIGHLTADAHLASVASLAALCVGKEHLSLYAALAPATITAAALPGPPTPEAA